VICDVAHGALLRVTPEGGTTTLMSGLSYPNGVEVDLDGYVYVSEHNAGRVRRVDPDTGDYTVIAEGLTNPNGLAFDPTHETLYVNSFGGGTVHAIARTGGDAWETTLFAEMPTDPGSGGCDGLSVGDECFLDWGIGACAEVGGDLDCQESLDEAACGGLAVGDFCVTSALEEVVNSVCADTGGALFCPKVPGEVVQACVGHGSGDSCEALGVTSSCDPSWEGVLICDITSWESVIFDACDGLAEGDACVVVEYEGYATGTCEPGQGGALSCDASWGGGHWGDYGLLDGLNVDICGNVYVTEYIAGYVWRFTEAGAEPELVVETGSSWIPNMKWGYGVGGWETDVLYVMDRDSRGIFAVDLGIPGKPTAFTP
jgi:sugar lactone lactonase YvrE